MQFEVCGGTSDARPPAAARRAAWSGGKDSPIACASLELPLGDGLDSTEAQHLGGEGAEDERERRSRPRAKEESLIPRKGRA